MGPVLIRCGPVLITYSPKENHQRDGQSVHKSIFSPLEALMRAAENSLDLLET